MRHFLWSTTGFIGGMLRRDPLTALLECADIRRDLKTCSCSELREPARSIVKICMFCAAAEAARQIQQRVAA